VVEVGTVRGFGAVAAQRHAPDGLLTTVDVESEHQRAAREAFTDAGIATTLPGDQRLRVEVLPGSRRAYDLVFVDADKSAYTTYHEQAVRLAAIRGVVAFDNALWHDRVATTPPANAER